MRKRNVQILFRLTEEEAEQLYSLVKKSGCSNGFLTLAGGVVITFAKEILTLITG